jgi:hypothetical protein
MKFDWPLGFQVITHLEEFPAGHIFGEEWCSVDQISGYEMKSARQVLVGPLPSHGQSLDLADNLSKWQTWSR